MANKYLSEKYLCLLEGFIAKKFGANLSTVSRNKQYRSNSENNKAEAKDFFNRFLKEHCLSKKDIPSDYADPFYVVLSQALAKATTRENPLKIKKQMEEMFVSYYDEDRHFKQGKSDEHPVYESGKSIEDEVDEIVPEDPLPEPTAIYEYLKKKY